MHLPAKKVRVWMHCLIGDWVKFAACGLFACEALAIFLVALRASSKTFVLVTTVSDAFIE